MPTCNLFDDIPAHLPEEITETLLSRGNLRIERIVSRGQSSPEGFWYDQDEDEWVLLLQGAAGLQFDDDGIRVLRPGDHLHIPAHRRHRVAWTDGTNDTIWLAVFFAESAQG